MAFCFGDICNDCYRELNPPNNNRAEIIFDEEDYKDKVKDRCFRCGAKLPGTIDHYMEYGNACKDSVNCKARMTLKNDGYLNGIRILV